MKIGVLKEVALWIIQPDQRGFCMNLKWFLIAGRSLIIGNVYKVKLLQKYPVKVISNGEIQNEKDKLWNNQSKEFLSNRILHTLLFPFLWSNHNEQKADTSKWHPKIKFQKSTLKLIQYYHFPLQITDELISTTLYLILMSI